MCVATGRVSVPRRLALLVATYKYEDAGLRQLAAPGHDAEALAEVLRDPAIAGFDVTVLVNEPHHVVGEAIGEFYHNRRRDDLTLLYFTGHGLKDDEGHLYLAMTNTKRDRLLFTGLSALQIDEAMESCASRQKVLVLDCCYSGAFPASRTSKADGQVHTLEKFRGKGRVVLTASDATQYSFEGDHILGQGIQSLFTRFLVEGLITGEADLDSDGDISLDELYGYVYDRVTEEMPQQRPKKQENIEGRIVIARNIRWSLPPHIRNAIDSPFAQERLAVLDGLAHLHRVGNDLVRAEVISETRRLADDDSKAVSAAATNLITMLNPQQARSKPEGAPHGVEGQARQAAEAQARQPAEEPPWVPAVTSTPPRHGATDQDESRVTSVSQPPPAADFSMWPQQPAQLRREAEGRLVPLKEKVSRLLLRHVPAQGWSRYARIAYYISLGMLFIWAAAWIASQKSWTSPADVIGSIIAYLFVAILPAWLLARLTIRLAKLDRSVKSQEPPQ
jgi:hypothetical protein